MRGRLTRWSPETAARLCAAFAAGQTSLTRLCKEPGMPSERCVRIWLRERDDFRAMWEEARAERAALFLERPELEAAARGRTGQSSTYSEAMAQLICARIAAGDSLWGLARDRDLPNTSTIYRWLDEQAEFRRMYRAAHDLRASAIEEEVMEIADDDGEDVLEGADGRPWANHQAVRRARLMMDARRWQVARLESRTALKERRTAEAEPPLTYAERLALLD